VLGAAFWLLSGERRHAQLGSFDLRGAALSTGGMLLLVYAIVRAPDVGWGATRTIAELTAAGALLTVFAINELRRANALLPLSIFRIKGLAAAYLTDLLPGLVVMSIGLGALLVAVTTAANAGVPAEKAGLAAALLNASQQLGGALGLAIFTAIAASHTDHLLAAHIAMPAALTSGFQWALLASGIFLVIAAVIATRTSNTRGEPDQDVLVLQPQPEIQASVAA
jgi:hypothetical protein